MRTTGSTDLYDRRGELKLPPDLVDQLLAELAHDVGLERTLTDHLQARRSEQLDRARTRATAGKVLKVLLGEQTWAAAVSTSDLARRVDVDSSTLARALDHLLEHYSGYVAILGLETDLPSEKFASSQHAPGELATSTWQFLDELVDDLGEAEVDAEFASAEDGAALTRMPYVIISVDWRHLNGYRLGLDIDTG